MKRAVFCPKIATAQAVYYRAYFFGYYDNTLKFVRIMNELFAKT